MRILMVCSGNTCRSPMAAAILERRLAEAGPAGVVVSSAGTGALEGAPASEGAWLVSLEENLDLSAHRARLLTRALVEDADLILAMSPAHLGRVEDLGGSGKAFLLPAFAGDPDTREVGDPYGGGVASYRHTFRELSRLMDGVQRRLAAEARHDRR